MERSGVLQATQFAYRKGLGICVHFSVGRTLGLCRLTSVQPLIATVNHQRIILLALLCEHWRFCVVYTNTVSITSITACYGGRLYESTIRCARNAAEKGFGSVAYYHPGE